MPEAPPLHDVSPGVVLAWVEEAAAALVLRDDRQRLIRQVLSVMDEEWTTRQRLQRLREQVVARVQEERERQEGIYWRRREAGRRAQRPVRVDVDPAAWRRGKAIALSRGIGLGEYVGELVTAATIGEFAAAGHRKSARRERLFARIAVDTDTWSAFVAAASTRGLAAARAVGELVEIAAEQST